MLQKYRLSHITKALKSGTKKCQIFSPLCNMRTPVHKYFQKMVLIINVQEYFQRFLCKPIIGISGILKLYKYFQDEQGIFNLLLISLKLCQTNSASSCKSVIRRLFYSGTVMSLSFFLCSYVLLDGMNTLAETSIDPVVWP